MRAAEAVAPSEVDEAAGIAAAQPDDVDQESTALGARLAAARERREWTRADVAARLKLPVALIGKLENDDYAGLANGVFLHGYLSSYARLVGVSLEQAASVAAAHTHIEPLVATGTISRSRYLFDRYSGSATYLVLTAIIVVPAVWLATHGGLEQNLARTTPLDPPASVASVRDAAPETPSTATSDASPNAVADAASVTSPAAPPIEQAPVIASMTPFASAPIQPIAEAPAAAAEVQSGAHIMNIKLSQQSWVEVLAADGRKLEYGILAAGTERSYRSDGPVSVRLGNVLGAEMRSDGKIVDLAPFQRGNVAHVRLFGDNGSGVSRVDQ